MIATLLSPNEIVSSIEAVEPFSNLAKNLRKGQWNLEEMKRAVSALDESILSRRNSSQLFHRDENYINVLAMLSILFYSKDKFAYSRETEEYLLVEQLFGRLIAALGL